MSPALLGKTARLKGSLYRDMLIESHCLYYRQWTSRCLLGENKTLPLPRVSQPDGSIRGGANTTSLGGSLIRSQRPGRKNSFELTAMYL